MHRSDSVPWQIWVVVALLSLEGIGNLLAIPSMPIAAVWLFLKCLFVAGLVNRWKWVFALFLIVAAMHVLAIEALGPVASLVNLVLMILVASTYRTFFPAERSVLAS